MSRYKLFVGHLSDQTRQKDLERFFKDYGFSRNISEVVVKSGYGFVVFDDRHDADDAIDDLNGKELLGSRIQVEYAKQSEDRGGRGGGGRDFGRSQYSRRDDRDDRGRDRRPSFGRGGGGGYRSAPSKFGAPYNTDYKVLIDNVSTRASWQDIKDHFRPAGEVTFAKCHRERMGQGQVEFASARDMKNAIRKLDNSELFGKRIRLSTTYRISRSRSPKSRSPRSRSRDRSRSPIVHQRKSPSPRRRSRSPSPRHSVSRSRSRSP